MNPSVRVSDTGDLLEMELQHTAAVNTGIFRKDELDTGRIRIEFPVMLDEASDK